MTSKTTDLQPTGRSNYFLLFHTLSYLMCTSIKKSLRSHTYGLIVQLCIDGNTPGALVNVALFIIKLSALVAATDPFIHAST